MIGELSTITAVTKEVLKLREVRKLFGLHLRSNKVLQGRSTQRLMREFSGQAGNTVQVVSYIQSVLNSWRSVPSRILTFAETLRKLKIKYTAHNIIIDYFKVAMQAIPTNQEIKAQGDKVVAIMKELEISTKWEKNGDKPCQMYKLNVEERFAGKGIAIVNFSFEEVTDFLKDDRSLTLIDPMLVEFKVLATLQGQVRVSYYQYKATWPVSNRDFISVERFYIENENKCYRGVKHLNYPYPAQPDVVRGVVHIGGYIIQRLEGNKTRVTYFSDADMKGSIPSPVANLISGWQGQVPSKIEPAMKSLKKK